MTWFWDLMIPLCLPNLLTQPFNQTPQIEAQPDQSMRQGGPFFFTKWCLSNQVDFRAPPVKSIADFLLYLFQVRKLQPSTIDDYRSAIADKQGNSTLNVSKDENLTRLLDSFHRDRPKRGRTSPPGTSSWCCTS